MPRHPHETIESLKKRVPTKAEIARRTPLGASEPLPAKPVTSTARELVAAKRQRQPAAEPTKSPAVPVVPARSAPRAAVAVRDDRSYQARYLDEVAPASIVGRMVKFSKDGKFVTHDDGKEIPEADEFTVLADETLVGWVKFNGDGEPPDREMGLLFDGYTMPLRETLGDLDESQWDEGLDGQPVDPWQHHQYLVLQNTKTLELFTFVTSSKTGRKAVGNVLKHYVRTKKTNPNELPVVGLRTGGFEHRDSRVGFVITPVFAVIGRQSRDSVAVPDTSTAAYLNDDLPDNLR